MQKIQLTNTKIMENSGAGSFAGILENVFEDAHLDEMNGIWKGMEFAEGLANANIEYDSEYYALLGDLVAGAYGSDIGADAAQDNVLSTASFATKNTAIRIRNRHMDSAAVGKA